MAPERGGGGRRGRGEGAGGNRGGSGRGKTGKVSHKGNGSDKRKRNDPAFQLMLRIDAAVRESDTDDAFNAFSEAQELDRSLSVRAYNALLQMCAGGAGNTSGTVMPEYADAVRAEIERRHVRKNEMSVTALARVAAANCDPKSALALVTSDRPLHVSLKLRSFSPALHAFAERKDVSNALLVEQIALEEGTQLNEYEYSALARAIATHGNRRQALALLQRLSNDLRMISESLLLDIRRLFTKSLEPLSAVHRSEELEQQPEAENGDCPRIHEESNEKQQNQQQQQQEMQDIQEPVLGSGWKCMMCNVDETSGQASEADEVALRAIDLSEEEFTRLREGIAKLAKERERENDFHSFLTWVENHKPEVYIDGANVGMFNRKPWAKGNFDFSQIDRVLNTARTETKKTDPPRKQPPVVVLHNIRTQKPPAGMSKNQLTIRQWRNQHSLFTSPHGSNDDWYWLYGAVAAGKNGILITNDELRDHMFQMLPEPRLFARWKERHQVRFDLTKYAVELYMPVPFTTCIQHDTVSSTGEDWWIFPSAEWDHWLLAWREKEHRPSQEQRSLIEQEMEQYNKEREFSIQQHREKMKAVMQQREEEESERKRHLQKERELCKQQKYTNEDDAQHELEVSGV
jgi:proteinaceous RNase P